MQCSLSCFFVPLQFCLLASLCLASTVSVSLLVFFWKITRSGAVRVHVFCAGCIDWMGWLHWAGFLCGPPANFMIYSAKGRGARPPVTTERELHVGLMISPQKCLLWLGLHGAQSPPTGWMVGRGGLKRELGWPAWVNTNAYHYTSTWRDYEGRRGQTESYIRLACSKCFKVLSFNRCSVIPVCVLLFFITHSAIFLSPSQPPLRLVASGRFQTHYWNVDTEDDVTKLSRTGRGAEIIGGVDKVGVGWWLWGEVFGIFFSAGVQVCWLKRVTAEGLDLDATLGAASLSVCLATTPQNKMMSFTGICAHSWWRDKITGVSLIMPPECEQVRELYHSSFQNQGWLGSACFVDMNIFLHILKTGNVWVCEQRHFMEAESAAGGIYQLLLISLFHWRHLGTQKSH